MNIDMKYGDTKFNAVFDDKNVIQVISGNEFKIAESEEEIIDKALKHPIASARLNELIHKGETVCIIISDSTRAWQKMSRYLYKIVDEINSAGVPDKDICFISAAGTHRKQSEEEHRMLLGDALSKRFKVIDHDCLDKSNLEYVGKTTYGTPVILNKKALECDHIILTGAIIYHFLVGYSGGKKSILPGISSYETIMANHALSLSKEFGKGTYPTVRSGNIYDNPIHEDMLQAASFVRPTFMFNVVMNNGRIAGAVAGNYIAAHNEGTKMVDLFDSVLAKEKSDLVIGSAGGYPKDINLYQCIKTIINERSAVKDGGTIIMVAECREGLGDNKDVCDIILNFNNVLDRERDLRKNYTISKYVGYYFCETAEKCRLILVSEIDPDLVKCANITVVKTLDEALKLAYSDGKADKTINLMPKAANTLPKFKDDDCN